MIRINLLPKEMAQADKTPIGLFLVIVGDVVLGAFAVLAFVYFHFISLKEADSRKAQAAEDYEKVRKYGTEHAMYTDLKTKYETRNEQISNLERTRLSWSRKLYELSQVLEGRQGEEKHPVYIENWEPTEPRATAAARPTGKTKGAAAAPVAQPSYEVKMTLHVARPTNAPPDRPIEHYLTAFRRDLTNAKEQPKPESPEGKALKELIDAYGRDPKAATMRQLRDQGFFAFWQDFLDISFPELKPDEKGAFEYYEESEFGQSNLTLKMKPLDWRFEPAKAPAAPGKKPGK